MRVVPSPAQFPTARYSTRPWSAAINFISEFLARAKKDYRIVIVEFDDSVYALIKSIVAAVCLVGIQKININPSLERTLIGVPMQAYQITFTFKYTDQVIPPRCRKARATQLEGQYTVSIPSLTSSEAPVAVIETDDHASPPNGSSEKYVTRVRHYRWYSNRLWYDHQIERFQDIEFEPVKPVIPSSGSPYQSLAEHQELARKWAESHILVNGVLHQPLKGEPRLIVDRDFWQDKYWVELKRYFDYEVTGFKFKDFYRLDQFEEAIAKCHEWVRRFQDDGDKVELLLPYHFEILIPEALALDPQADQARADEQDYQNNLKKLVSETKLLFRESQQCRRALKEALTFLN